MVITFSNFVKSYFLFILATIGVLVFAIKRIYATEKGNRVLDKMLLKSPVFGPLIRKVAVAKFTRTLGTLITSGVAIIEALTIGAKTAGNKVVEEQVRCVAIPRRFSTPMREIWTLQARFHNTKGKRPLRLLTHPRFRAAYDFLLLRAESGEADPELAAWWTKFQEQQGLDPKGGGNKPAGNRRRRRRPRKRPAK